MRKLIGALLIGATSLFLSTLAVAEDPPTYTTQWGSYGSGTGQFNNVQGIDVDPSNGYVYVAERFNGRVQKFTLTGSYINSISLPSPRDVAIDSNGNLFVIDAVYNAVYKYSSSGSPITNWGGTGTANGQFSAPNGICVGPSNNVYVADTYNYRVQKFTNTGSFVLAWGSPGTGDNQFGFPRGITVDPQEYVYVVDSNASKVKKFTSEGSYITSWGSYGYGDGQFIGMYNAGTDENNNVYVADSNNNRIQKFTSTGTFLSKWGSGGTGNGQFNHPAGVAASNQKVYVADTNNYRVQVFEYTGPPVPSASNSTIPNVLYCPDGSIPYLVTIRDTQNNSMSGVTVSIIFSPQADATICWCQGGDHTVSAVTNGDGQASFYIAAGGCMDPAQLGYMPATIMVDGSQLKQVGCVSPDAVDQDSNFPWEGWNPTTCRVGLEDAVVHTGPIKGGYYSFCTDFDSDMDVDLDDAVLQTPPVRNGATCQ